MTLVQKIRESSNILNPVNQLEKLFDSEIMTFGNWLLLNNKHERLYDLTPAGLMRKPMKDILKIYKKEKGL